MVSDSEMSIDELQIKIGYDFKNGALLRQALCHKSYANEIEGENSHGNERLEFLGDAVLELAITHLLMTQFPEYPEGRLSQLRAAIVNKDGIAAIATAFDWAAICCSDAAKRQAGEEKRNQSWQTYMKQFLQLFIMTAAIVRHMSLLKNILRSRLLKRTKKAF